MFYYYLNSSEEAIRAFEALKAGFSKTRHKLVVFSYFFGAVQNFKKNNFWCHPFRNAEELQKKSLETLESLSDQERGSLDYAVRKKTRSLLKEAIRKRNFFFSTSDAAERKVEEYFSNQEKLFPELFDPNLPEGVKEVLFISLLESYQEDDPVLFCEMAKQSGLGVAFLTRRLFLNDKISKEGAKEILFTCARFSGIRILPYLENFQFSSEDLEAIVRVALDHSKPEHFYAFAPSEISGYLEVFPKSLILEVKAKREAIAPYPPHYATYVSDRKNLIRKWKAFYEEGGAANRRLFIQTIADIDSEEESSPRLYETMSAIRTSFLFIKQKEKESPEASKLAALKKLFILRPEGILESLELFKLQPATKVAFLDFAVSKDPRLVFEKFPSLNIPESAKIALLEKACKDPQQAPSLLRNFHHFTISTTEAFDTIRHALESIMQMPEQVLDLSNLGLDVGNKEHRELIGRAIHYALGNELYNQNEDTIFTSPEALIKIDPNLKEIEPILQLAHIVSFDSSNLWIRHIHQISLEEMQDAFRAMESKSPELAKLLSLLFRKRKIASFLKEINSFETRDPLWIQKGKELTEANRGFKEIIRAYLLIAYDSSLNEETKQYRWKALAEMVTRIEQGNYKPAETENIFAFLGDMNASNTLATSSLPGMLSILSPLLVQAEQDEAALLLEQETEFLEPFFTRDFVRFLSFLIELKLPPFAEQQTIAFLVKEICKDKSSTQERWPGLLSAITMFAQMDCRFSDFLMENDGAALEQEALRRFGELFSVPESALPKLAEVLKGWKKPELLIRFYQQWQQLPNITDAFKRWFSYVTLGPGAYLGFRINGDDRKEYFAGFPEEIVKLYQKEEILNSKEAASFWEFKKPKPCEKSQAFLATLYEKAPALFQCEIGDEVVDLKGEHNWEQLIKKIKKLHSHDVEVQKALISRIKLLKNCSILERSENSRVSLKAAKELQNLLGIHQESWEQLGLSEKVLESIQAPLAHFIAFCQSGNPFKGLVFEFTHDPETLFTISERTLGSCQSVSRAEFHNKALLGRIQHGKQKLLIIRNVETGEPIGVVTLKLLKDIEGKPLILREPVFQCMGCTLTSLQLEEVATLALLHHFKEWGITFVVGKLDSENGLRVSKSPYFLINEYPTEIINGPGATLFEYEDTTRYLSTQSKAYKLPAEYLLEFTLAS